MLSIHFVLSISYEFHIGTIAIAEARRCAVIVPKKIDSFPGY